MDLVFGDVKNFPILIHAPVSGAKLDAAHSKLNIFATAKAND